MAIDAASWLLSGLAWCALLGAQAGAALFIVVLAHEGAHALMMIRSGIPVKKFRAWFLFAFVEPGVRLVPGKRDFYVSLAGPLSGLPLAVVGVTGYLATGSEFLIAVAGFAVALSLINSLPVGPLDGGRVACAIGRSFKTVTRALFFSVVVVATVGVQVQVWGVSGWTAFVAFISSMYFLGQGFCRREVAGNGVTTWTEDQRSEQIAWDAELPCNHFTSTLWFLGTAAALLTLAIVAYRVAPPGVLLWT